MGCHSHIGAEEDKVVVLLMDIFLIDAQIRPMLMVLGFAFASLVIVAIGTLLNMLFTPVLLNVQSSYICTGLASMAGLLMVYARIPHPSQRVFLCRLPCLTMSFHGLEGVKQPVFLGLAESTKVFLLDLRSVYVS